ncbi:retrovirus-related pol polyprotein from transposon TNT 1-94 [Tanacetum coccineum]
MSDNSLYKTKRVWKATGKLFADIGYQWRPTGKKLTLGKLDCGSQWRPTGKKFALGEICQLTKLSVKCSTLYANQKVMLWYLDSGCSKHMTGNRSKLMNFVEKFIGSVRFIRTDNGTEFVNQVMSEYYEGVGIFHQKSVPRTPQQNGVVERRNRTLVEAARTMMIFSKAPQKSSFDIHLVDDHVLGCRIGNEYSDGLYPCNWSKRFFKINTFLLTISLCN